MDGKNYVSTNVKQVDKFLNEAIDILGFEN
jgi:hypothetical protein